MGSASLSTGQSPLRATVIAVVVFSATYFFARDYLSFAYLQSHRDQFVAHYQQQPFFDLAVFFIFYVGLSAISFPGASLLTIVGGYVFGFWVGLVTVSFASTIGATLAFLAARHYGRDWTQKRLGKARPRYQTTLRSMGRYVLATLRLNPFVPFFLVNLAAGVSEIGVFDFIWISQVAMIPGTALYANAGLQLSTLRSAQDILSPTVVISLVALSAFPIAIGRWLRPAEPSAHP